MSPFFTHLLPHSHSSTYFAARQLISQPFSFVTSPLPSISTSFFWNPTSLSILLPPLLSLPLVSSFVESVHHFCIQMKRFYFVLSFPRRASARRQRCVPQLHSGLSCVSECWRPPLTLLVFLSAFGRRELQANDLQRFVCLLAAFTSHLYLSFADRCTHDAPRFAENM